MNIHSRFCEKLTEKLKPLVIQIHGRIGHLAILACARRAGLFVSVWAGQIDINISVPTHQLYFYDQLFDFICAIQDSLVKVSMGHFLFK